MRSAWLQVASGASGSAGQVMRWYCAFDGLVDVLADGLADGLAAGLADAVADAVAGALADALPDARANGLMP